ELVQLWYQMALNARRDLSLAPSARAGFEMTMLRMLAFRPAQDATPATAAGSVPRVAGAAAAKAALADVPTASLASIRTISEARTAPAASSVPTPEVVAAGNIGNDIVMDAERWLALVTSSALRGPARELAAHAGFVGYDAGVLRLSLSPLDEHLKAPNLVKLLAESIASDLGGQPQIRFETSAPSVETLHQRSTRQRDERQIAAESSFMADAGIQQLINQHGAALVPDSIRPLDD
ncbi:MAG: polymerase subunit gamma/tau, partial [Xanthomonadaceae bacterium]|nr:polymerase subunit gamma/tau [Xanthomonadaceae bacterium]